MAVKSIATVSLKLPFLCAILICTVTWADANKIVIGATELVSISNHNIEFIARIDTGAKTSSIHAENITIDTSGDPTGKPISFQITNRKGDSFTINTVVDSIITIRTSEGVEQRYKVKLSVNWKNKTKMIHFTLNDRSEMRYAALLGRNWLQGDFVVDVEKNNPD